MVIRKDQPFDGACYHLVLRGNNRSFVLHDDADKDYLLALLRRYKARGAFELFHYCLMDNHVHLVVRLMRGDQLGRIMQGLSQSFTNHWKRKRDFVGCLWQVPYRRFLITDRRYLMECGRYIELNPVRANMVASAGDYQWSSYRVYAHGAQNRLVDFDPEYLSLHQHASTRQVLYRYYVEARRPSDGILDAALMQHGLRRINPWDARAMP